VHQFKGHSQAITGIKFLRDGIQFLTTSLDQSIRMWSVESFKQLY